MACVLADSPTMPNTETLHLVHLLNSLEQELDQPYIERRLRSVSHKSSALDELQDAIQELTQREKDLQASIGISKMLIDNNNNLLQENNDLRLDIFNIKNHNKHLQSEICRYKEELETSEEKYQELNKTLIKTESELIQLASDTSRSTGNESEPEIIQRRVSLDRLESELFDVSAKFKQDHDFLLSSKLEAEKKLRALEGKLNDYGKFNSELENKLEELSKKLKKSEKAANKLREQYAAELQTREETEILYDQLYDKHQKLLRISERQAEELEIVQNYKDQSAPVDNIEGESLKSELETLEEDEQALEQVLKKTLTLPTNLKNSFRALPRTLGIHKQLPQFIKRRSDRKSPCEEYFFLATQAIKLNSPYMDTICTISPKHLFETANKSEVPFHKWHLWIENQLNSAYLSNIYQKPLTPTN